MPVIIFLIREVPATILTGAPPYMVLLEGLALEFRIYFNSLACLAVFFFAFSVALPPQGARI